MYNCTNMQEQTHCAFYNFSEVKIVHIITAKKGRRFQVCYQFSVVVKM